MAIELKDIDLDFRVELGAIEEIGKVKELISVHVLSMLVNYCRLKRPEQKYVVVTEDDAQECFFVMSEAVMKVFAMKETPDGG